MLHILEPVTDRIRSARFHRAARPILDTAPIVPRDDGVILFSMMGTRVLLAYLVAIKSVHSSLQRGRVVILNDGTLTQRDRAILAHHCGHPQIIPIASVDTGPCPRGGTWERLLTILDLRRDNYVVQIDSDVVARGAMPEVAQAIADGRCFTLRGEEESELLDVASIARQQQVYETSHVQGLIEQQIDRVAIPGCDDLRYVRGCSGFAGFAPSTDGRALAEAFSAEAERLIGRAKWAEWGSEQVTSNFVIANTPDPLLLPYDRYMNFWDAGVPDGARLVHFIGTYRYDRGTYARAARDVIARLRATPDEPLRLAPA
ncbi:hypothetical protein [Alteriqipengyuania lutimaris]|uniref:Uncharacterized protein n=1 Tax=Alteriqipengyuania lutimaris TaxID=1538146 RepID=A0A395LL13_9SPHN|nr:hypothetical protein [Alteriqipengyuania lutimaris]MBB3033625.1 hypothetical protein [Alteriqipengyuania lutimaris]RDS77379.1 hypothetical protein DL238_06970 [Alteriqipengyuania lutimaris]